MTCQPSLATLPVAIALYKLNEKRNRLASWTRAGFHIIVLVVLLKCLVLIGCLYLYISHSRFAGSHSIAMVWFYQVLFYY